MPLGHLRANESATAALAATILSFGLLLGNPAASQAGERPYQVDCAQNARSGSDCKVDKSTYIGWRTYHAFCHQCHAQDAVGSSFAPSLLDRLQQIDRERFMSSVANGFTGQVGVMPPWKDDPNVNKRYDELYAYLKARSDGALPPGRPQR